MITHDKITDIFCMVDEFSKKFDMEIAKCKLISSNGGRRRHRNASLSDGEIMTILIVFHFGTFANFKHYIKVHLNQNFPDAVSYNRFVELESRVFFKMMFFCLWPLLGHQLVDSMMIPVCHNLRCYANKVFKGMATDGKGTMEWCHGFKLHFTCNDRGGIITFFLPEPMWTTGQHKNRLMPFWDKTMLRKCFIIACNNMLKNTAKLVHSRHRPINNFLMNWVAALAAYCFYNNKLEALQGDTIEHSLSLY